MVPEHVKNEMTMRQVRFFYIPNYFTPGAIENIHPNKFLRLKPKEEFPLMPLIPISPSRMKRFKDELEAKRKEGYKFRVDKARMYSLGLLLSVTAVFCVLVYLLNRKDEELWVRFERERTRKGARLPTYAS